MIHYCCDLCHRTIGQHERRYVVRMDAFPGEEEIVPEELEEDRDHLAELDELLQGLEPEECPEAHRRQWRFDLCPQCYRRFVQNPLGREATGSYNISPN